MTDETVSAYHEWTPEGVLDAQEAHQRLRRPKARPLKMSPLIQIVVIIDGLVSLLILAGFATALREGQRIETFAFLILLVGVFVWFVIYLVFFSAGLLRKLNLAMARRALRGLPDQQRRTHFTFGPDSITVETGLSSSRLDWAIFRKIVEAENGCMLFETPSSFRWIPAHAFASASAVQQFTVLARDRAVQYVVLEPCQFPAKPDSPRDDDF
jgi:hypothetical protein